MIPVWAVPRVKLSGEFGVKDNRFDVSGCVGDSGANDGFHNVKAVLSSPLLFFINKSLLSCKGVIIQ